MNVLKHWLKKQTPRRSLKWLAEQISLSPHTVKKWKRVPPRHCLAIEQVTAGSVTRHDLRPDIFGPEIEAA